MKTLEIPRNDIVLSARRQQRNKLLSREQRRHTVQPTGFVKYAIEYRAETNVLRTILC